ncbi:5483_t:CDS:2, partial [Racocetra fulgida]
MGRKDEYDQPQALFSSLIKTNYSEQKQSLKQKYGFGIGYTKKALDYAVWTDNVDELVSYLEKFIEKAKLELNKQEKNDNVENIIINNSIYTKYKEHLPKYYKLGEEDLPRKKVRNIRDITNSVNQVNQVLDENEITYNPDNGNLKH